MGEVKFFNNLKPCPFCGCQKVVIEKSPMNVYEMGNIPDAEGYFYAVFCNDCAAELGGYITEEQAIEAWNTRIGDEKEFLIHCKDCKHRDLAGVPPFMYYYCACGNGLSASVKDDDFCPYGELRTDE